MTAVKEPELKLVDPSSLGAFRVGPDTLLIKRYPPLGTYLRTGKIEKPDMSKKGELLAWVLQVGRISSKLEHLDASDIPGIGDTVIFNGMSAESIGPLNGYSDNPQSQVYCTLRIESVVCWIPKEST